MARSIWVNICVKDLTAAVEFYTSIGAVKNETFSNETVSCMVFSSTINIMLLLPDAFQSFTPPGKQIADSSKVSEVLLCLSVDQKEEVDQIITKAVSQGGKADPTKLPQMPGMYGRSFEDLDGHVLQFMWMDMELGKEHWEKEAQNMKERCG